MDGLTLSAYAAVGALLVLATYKVSMWYAFRRHSKAMAEAARILAILDDDED